MKCKQKIDLIVAGSRWFNDRRFIFEVLDGLYEKYDIQSVVSGLADGPDTIGKEWADSKGIPVNKCPALWNQFKNTNAAGIARNAYMSSVGDALVSFWDMESTGTEDMISRMRQKERRKQCKFVYVIDVSFLLNESSIFD